MDYILAVSRTVEAAETMEQMSSQLVHKSFIVLSEDNRYSKADRPLFRSQDLWFDTCLRPLYTESQIFKKKNV